MWDPGKYLTFGDHRGRPFHELCARVGAVTPRKIVDLGCGPGNLTVTLADRWPEAKVEALDTSAEMVEAARELGLDARQEAIEDWLPDEDTDVVIANAALQWVPGHVKIMREWIPLLPRDSWLAVQVPGNLNAPSHRAIRELVATPKWRDAVGDLSLRGPDTVREPTEYAETLLSEGMTVDAWETTYQQRLIGVDPVLNWVQGTALTPIRDVLDDEAYADFCAELAPMLREAYPPSFDGSTFFPFRRIFVVAHKP